MGIKIEKENSDKGRLEKIVDSFQGLGRTLYKGALIGGLAASLAFSSIPARADFSALISTSVGTVAPIQNEDIVLEQEYVDALIKDIGVSFFMDGSRSEGDFEADVNAEFLFRNTGPKQVVKMGFPFPDREINYYENFQCYVDGEKINSTLMEEGDVPVEFPIVNASTSWEVIEVPFEKNQTRLVRCSYTAFSDWNVFSYSLATGANWRGNIGYAKIAVRFGKDLFPELVYEAYPEGYQKEKDRIVWELRDFEPKKDPNLINSEDYDHLDILKSEGNVVVGVSAPYIKLEGLEKIANVPEEDIGFYDSIVYPPGDIGKVIKNGHVMYGVRDFAELFGIDLSWNNKTKEAKLAKNNNTLVFKIGSSKALVNGKKVEMPYPAEIHRFESWNGEFGGYFYCAYAPLRVMAETFGYNLEWQDGSIPKVIISGPEARPKSGLESELQKSIIDFLNYSDYGSDTDNDGLYNYLVVKTEIDVKKPGNYIFLAHLMHDTAGYTLSDTVYTESLDVGKHEIQFKFSGEAINKFGANGTFNLDEILVFILNNKDAKELHDAPPVNSLYDVYTTSNYDFTQFQKNGREEMPEYLRNGDESDTPQNNLELEIEHEVSDDVLLELAKIIYQINPPDFSGDVYSDVYDENNVLYHHKKIVYAPVWSMAIWDGVDRMGRTYVKPGIRYSIKITAVK